MKVAKLSTGKVVQLLAGPTGVRFDSGSWVLVCDRLTDRKRRQEPYWEPACLVVWVLSFD